MADQKDSFSEADHRWMALALEIAARGAGYVSPNPLVGCVVVSSEGEKIGQGYHEHYGQAHAEVHAINAVKRKEQLAGATVYVTLEPCSHHGQTPPCCEFLSHYPISRVVVAMKDPTAKVNGKGIAYLREHDIRVDVGLMEEEALELNEFFLHAQRYNRPFVMLKIAQTLDGYIAAPDGDSKWISGEEARAQVHRWRSTFDAVMVGRNTARLDNPRLTVRHVEGRQPKRIVIDGPGDLPEELNLFTDQYEEKTIRVTHNAERISQEDPMLKMLSSNYFRGQTLLVPERKGHTDLDATFKKLSEQGIQSVFVEAGQNLASALINEHLVDKLACFVAPKLLGGGTRSVMGAGINRMNEIITFRKSRWQHLGNDMLFTGYF